MKRIESPVKKFPGAVEFHDPLPYLTVLKFERVAREAKKDADAGEIFIPVILEAVEKWDLQNFPEQPTLEAFPGTPRAAIHQLIAWLLNEMTAIYKGSADDDPNA
jgi:hypothetical protein